MPKNWWGIKIPFIATAQSQLPTVMSARFQSTCLVGLTLDFQDHVGICIPYHGSLRVCKEISPFERLLTFPAEQEHALKFFISESPCQIPVTTVFTESIFPHIMPHSEKCQALSGTFPNCNVLERFLKVSACI